MRGTGPGGRISQDDVKTFTKQVMSSLGGGGQASVATLSGGSVALPDFSKWGAVERKPMSGIRRKTAEHLSHAWNAIPHVTQFDKADITQLEQVRKKFRPEVEKAGGNLTVTAIAAKVIASALKVFPQFNASVDARRRGHRLQEVHPRRHRRGHRERPARAGDPQRRPEEPHPDLGRDPGRWPRRPRPASSPSTRCRAARCRSPTSAASAAPPFTPIVNWPEVAILGISRGGFEPVWNGTAFEPRQMLPLSLSYDHRLIDGADAIRFLRWVVDALEHPFTLTLRGSICDRM